MAITSGYTYCCYFHKIKKLTKQTRLMTTKEKAVITYVYEKHNQDRCIGFCDGYTQCQKDTVEELKEWIDITLSAKSKLGASDNVIEALLTVKYKIESLNKQD